MVRICRDIWQDETAQSIVEYALILAMILILVIGAVSLIGRNFLK